VVAAPGDTNPSDATAVAITSFAAWRVDIAHKGVSGRNTQFQRSRSNLTMSLITSKVEHNIYLYKVTFAHVYRDTE